MADKTKKTANEAEINETTETAVAETKAKKPEAPTKPKTEYVEFRVPLKGKEQTMFVGVNFKNYILKRGEWVRVPKEVYEVVMNAERAEETANAFAQAKEDAYFEKAANPTQTH